MMLAELRVLIGRSVRMRLTVFLPQQQSSHAFAAQLPMDPRQIDGRAFAANGWRLCAQLRFDAGFIETRPCGPIQSGRLGTRHVLADDALGQSQGTRDALMRQPAIELQSKTL